MPLISYILYILAGAFFLFGVYNLLLVVFKFGPFYDNLRARMEDIRKDIQECESSSEVPDLELVGVIENFNASAKSLKIELYKSVR